MERKNHDEMAFEAYQLVSKQKKTDKEFRSLARSFPSMLQVNGLGGAVAFLFSKQDKKPWQTLYQAIDEWTDKRLEGAVTKRGREDGAVGQTKVPELMERITRLDSAGYRVYTNEVMSLCLWIKRFAEGWIEAEALKQGSAEKG